MKDFPFGQIISITGIEILIEVSAQVLQGNLEQSIVVRPGANLTLPVGIVGDIFVVGGTNTHNTKLHYAIFEEIKLVSTVDIGNNGVSTERNKAIATAKLIGYQDRSINERLSFKRGTGHYPTFNSKCYLLSPSEKKQLFSLEENIGVVIGKVPGTHDEEVAIHINKFLGKHSVILGSTGSGKSCTVASILQSILRIHRYSHIIFFDPHDEYSNAFPNKRGKFKVNKISSSDLTLPYWILNFDEFQNVFLGEIDTFRNSNGIRILKEEIVRLKYFSHLDIEEEIGSIEKVNINSPLYYSIENDLIPSLKRLNKRTIWKSDGELALNEAGEFLASSGNRNIQRSEASTDNVIQDSNYYGQLEQIIEKLESIILDRRYQFLFQDNFGNSKSFYRYIESLLSVPIDSKQTQLSIIDLSKLPSEVVPLLIGVLSRLCFEYKLWESNPNKLPIYLVLEEAHNYIPKETTALTKLTKKYISRIAKEGRKYGINQLIVSQRPSDLDETIVSQCSNFFILRVTNPNDQSFIRSVMPDHLSALSNMIPFFENGECLIAGECVTIPTKVLISPPFPEPNSKDVQYSFAWRNPMRDYDIREAIHKWWEVK